MGQMTIKFNTILLSQGGALDDWFPLAKRLKSSEDVSGDIHLRFEYIKGTGDVVQKGERDEMIHSHGSSSCHADGTGQLQKGKERSMTLSGLAAAPDLRVTSAFNSDEVNKKLQTNAFAVLPEDVVEDDETQEDSERVRVGPSTVTMEKMSKETKDLSFSSKNLEVQSQKFLTKALLFFALTRSTIHQQTMPVISNMPKPMSRCAPASGISKQE
jgi:hypothetical protein